MKKKGLEQEKSEQVRGKKDEFKKMEMAEGLTIQKGLGEQYRPCKIGQTIAVQQAEMNKLHFPLFLIWREREDFIVDN